ncbi:MAG TPA: Rap1a/Tai family immunity protein [Vitreimonas sp.]|nr:Rap1a/Tai family immunity protein [Vitreimonas sp.]
MRKAFLVLALLFHTQANAVSGNELYGLITSNDPSDFLEGTKFILGHSGAEKFFHYLEGVLAAEEKREPDFTRFACVPSDVTIGQAVDVIKKYLLDNPDKRHFDANQLAHFALIQAWPCK